MDELASRHCVPCQGGVPPLNSEEIGPLAAQLPKWVVQDGNRLLRDYEFRDFRTALSFTNAIGEIAESEGHHPDISLGWGRVGIELFTHKIDGLTESDFVLAAKIEKAAGDAQGRRG